MRKVTTSLFSYLILFFAVFTTISCNNASNQEQKKTAPDSAAVAGAPAGVKAVDPRLDVLYMEAAQFNDLMPNPGAARKWVFKHALTNEQLGNFTLSVWRENSRRFETPPVYLKNWIDSKTDLGYSAVLFGDQSLQIPQVRKIQQKLSTDPSLKYIIFVPKLGTKTYEAGSFSIIFYDLFLSATLEEFESNFKSPNFLTMAAFEVTNPSPPATALDQ